MDGVNGASWQATRSPAPQHITTLHNTRGQKAKKRRFLRNGMGCYVRQFTEDAKKGQCDGAQPGEGELSPAWRGQENGQPQADAARR